MLLIEELVHFFSFTILLFYLLFHFYFNYKKYIYYIKKEKKVYNNIIFNFLFEKELNVFFFYIFYLIICCFIFFTNIHSRITSNFLLSKISEISNFQQIFLYKFISLWSNQNSSFFFLILLLIILLSYISNFFYKNIFFFKKSNLQRKYISMIFFLILPLFFLVQMNFSSNPMILLKEKDLNNIGKDLSITLYDIVMVIHPPVLYLGFFLSILFFLIMFEVLLNNRFFKNHFFFINKFSKIAWFWLSFGILLGSFWAYHVLGWGGIWFWDPVENLSLIPWISITILIHFINFYKNYNFYLFKNILRITFLSLIISLISFFIIRFGLFQSVHTFIVVKLNIKIVFIFTFLIFFYLLLEKYIQNSLKIQKRDDKMDDNDFSHNYFFYLYFTIILTSILLTILFLTTFPYIYKYLFNKNIFLTSKIFINAILPLIILFINIFFLFKNNFLFLKKKLNNLFLYLNFKYIFFLIIFLINLNLYFYIFLKNIFLIDIILIDLLLMELLFIISIFYFYKNNNKLKLILHYNFFITFLIIYFINLYIENIYFLLKPGEYFIFNNFILYFNHVNFFSNTFMSVCATNTECSLFSTLSGEFLGRFSTTYKYFENLKLESYLFSLLSNNFNDYHLILGNNQFGKGFFFNLFISNWMSLFWYSIIIILVNFILLLYQKHFYINKNYKNFNNYY